MSWWQKKLLRYGLRYGLSRTGLLDDTALDLDNLDIKIGSKNVVELKDVGLNIERISRLAQLPPSLRLEIARVILLRLTIPADFYQSSIVAEVDGVELTLRFEGDDDVLGQNRKSRPRSPGTVRTPQHRKVNRRPRSPTPSDHGSSAPPDEDLHIPTTQEVAKSFLREEPFSERRELEASIVNPDNLEESFTSQGSESGEVGTGVAIGLPSFLANFLQGLVDRFVIDIKNVEVKVDADVGGDGQYSLPMTLQLQISRAQLDKLNISQSDVESKDSSGRSFRLGSISLNLLTDAPLPAGLSEQPSTVSSVGSDRRSNSLQQSEASALPLESLSPTSQLQSQLSEDNEPAPSIYHQQSEVSSSSIPAELSTIVSGESSQLEQAAEDGTSKILSEVSGNSSDLEIQPGDDNLSWGSRRSQTDAPAEDLWSSMVSEDELPDSLLIEPERAATPRAPSPYRQSSSATRSRRAVSPYDRGFRSPGSWPTLDDSPDQPRPRSPHSWPLQDHGQHSAFEPLAQVLNTAQSQTTDNKALALEHADPIEHSLELSSDLHDVEEEDMSQSRMFSHEEAQSMYMSAMTTAPEVNIPGGWSSESQSSIFTSQSLERESDEPGPPSEALAELEGSPSARGSPSGNVTPRAQTPHLEPVPVTNPATAERVVRQLLSLDRLVVSLPFQADSTSSPQEPTPVPRESMYRSASHLRGMPGTFSAYSDMSSSRRRMASSTADDLRMDWPTRESPPAKVSNAPLHIEVGCIQVAVDLPTVRLLYRFSNKVISSIGDQDRRSTTTKSTPGAADSSQASVCVSVQHLALSVCRSIGSGARPNPSRNSKTNEIICLTCERLDFASSSNKDLEIGALTLSLCGSEILSLSPGGNVSTDSRILRKSEMSLVARMSSDMVLVDNRPITELTVETSPVMLKMDTMIIEETLEIFGGLSGIIELSNSVASESAASSPRASTRPSKGVHFAGDLTEPSQKSELKLNARVGGIHATLCGSECSVVLRTSTLKAVYREQGVVATVEHMSLNGPYHGNDGLPSAISADLNSLRVDFLTTPQDKDLERLLSLLTPSRDKYENDDDILIDTLLRQRRKGALLRLSIGLLRFKLNDWNCSSSLNALGDELKKLSAVASYLPEDERPGLLTFCRLKEFESRMPVSEQFGTMRIGAQDFHLAHVGLPALLALSVGQVSAHRDDGTALLHALLPLTGVENLPMVMARMLGDEADPSIKIKLFNLCIEYSPPVVTALAAMDQAADIEEMAASLAQTVADLATHEVKLPSDASHSSKKRVLVDLLVHESAIGLEPRGLSSKALLVLADAHFTTKVPPEETVAIRFDFRQASIFLTDNLIKHEQSDPSSPATGHVRYASGKNRLIDSLSTQGYVSVVSIMSAAINVRIRELEEDQSKAIEVYVKNELLLLETCADSTHTLIATLGALAPETAPSKQPKYLTEPMTIEDMMASFTGDVVEERNTSPETLFDVDTESTEELDMPLEYSTLLEDADGLLAESEMTSSLYGPVSGIFGAEDESDATTSTADNDGFPETAESLLEEDPFEMTITPEEMPLGDAALMKSLAKQSKPAVTTEPVEIELYEVEDLGFDALASSQTIVGHPHRFHAPHPGNRHGSSVREGTDSPFQLRLRDFHVIWNMYDGYDWQWTRDGIAEAVEQVEQKAEERRARRQLSLNEREDDESVIGDFLFNSIYIGAGTGNDAQELRRQINRNIDDQMSETESVPISALTRPTSYSASTPSQRTRSKRRLKLGRSRNHKIAFELKGVSADIRTFPPGKGDVISTVDLRLKDFEIFDNVPSSTWRKFLTHLNNDPSAREMSKPMFHIEVDTVKTLESHSASELTLHVSVLPLRLHVDQDALDFITRFFEFKDERTTAADSGGEQPFIQRVEVDTVDLCLDYKPKHIDFVGLRSGRTKEFMNFITLEGANIRLKHAIVYGLRGFDTLHDTLNNVWMPDVTRNQLPTVLAGLAPVRSLVNLGTGVRDVVAIPIREYQKDGRIVRSIQKGAYHFGRTTASELARLGAKVALGTQTVLSTAEDYLSPARPSSARGMLSDQDWRDAASDEEEPQRRAVSAYANQPLGVLAGLRSARRHLEHDLLTARDALIAVQGEVLESGGPGAAAAAVARHAPTVILRPVIGATRAVGTTLLGVGNQIDRSNLRRVDDVSAPPDGEVERVLTSMQKYKRR